jgi:broad specificity phosphatase PhoE
VSNSVNTNGTAEKAGASNGSGRQPVVFLARHGTPDWNMHHIRYDIPPGPPLVPQGEEEAAKLGEFLKANGVRQIFASPLVRAHRTAEIAGEVAGVPVAVVDDIAEYRREENDQAVGSRFAPVFDQAWALAQVEGPVAIVSHGGPVRVMLDQLGILPDHAWHYRRQFDHQNPLPPAGAWAVTQDATSGEWVLRLVFSPQQHTEYLPATVYV